MKLGALFAGYGGLDMAVTAVTGAEVAWVVENDRAASKVLARHGLGPNLGDVTRVDWTQVEPVDVLTGGFPCQDVSHAGKRAGLRDGTRTGLWAAFCDAIDVLRPGLVVAENVRGLLSAGADSAVEPCAGCVGDRPGDVLRALGRVLGDLAGLGYDARWCGLRAADVGAPHGRFRVFVVAYPHGGRLIERDETVGGVSVANPQRHGDVTLLPTPRATDGAKGGPNQRGSSGDLMLPSAVLLPTPAVNDAQRRIVDRSRLDPETGCWIWTGWTNQAATPYGRVSINGAKVYAHRASYEAFVGPIPVGHEVDHLCQVSLCVNPEHLEAVTPGENRQRVMLRRTHCKRGHEFTDENTYWVRPGARACRACRAWQDKARKRGDDVPLLPTPVHNDMGAGKTVEAWDEWTAAQKAKHGNGNGHGPSLSIEALRLLPTPRALDATGVCGVTPNRSDSANARAGETLTDISREARWGKYAAAIHRWEMLTRPAPPPTEPTGKAGAPRLSPRFVEWMMGLPDGWVTTVPDLSRNDQLKMLGNGVVPQQAMLALAMLDPVEVAA